jgi:hypothetical protein
MNPPVNRSSESPKQPKKTKPPASSGAEPNQVVTPEITQPTESSEVVPVPSQPLEAPVSPPQMPPAEQSTVQSPPQTPQAKSNQTEVAPTAIPADAKIAVTKPSKPIKLKASSDSVSSQTPENETADSPIDRNQPIPPPSHPRQYRAIGLVYGQYQREEDQLTKGNIITPDGTSLDAVVLGRVISLVKNHLDLEKPHLWVVYPRTRQEDDNLHVQIVGVWEPETLNKEENLEGEEAPLPTTPPVETSPNPGYFSIRGEVIFASQEEETIIIKIRQSPKKDEEKPKFFKLKLKGTLPSNRPFKRFWDLKVQLQGSSLMIQQGEDLGFASKRKPFDRRDGGGGRSFGQRQSFRDEAGNTQGSRPSRAEARPEGTEGTPVKRPLPSKPIKNKETRPPE